MSAQPQRRRFFPAKRVQTEPGQNLRLEVQLHPQGAATAAEEKKPANPSGAQPPVWAGYLEHDGTPMTALRVDSADNAEARARRQPSVFVAHCPGAVQVQWQATFYPALTGVTWLPSGDGALLQDYPALSLEPLPPLRQEDDRTLPPSDPDYPWPLSGLPPALQPDLHQLADPFERPPLEHTHTAPGGAPTWDLSARPWQIIPAGNTCTVTCLPQATSPPRWSGRLVLTALVDGQALGSVELHSQHWFYT